MTDGFRHIRPIDRAKFDALGPDERYSQKLLERGSGATHSTLSYIKTPPGGGSSEGLHTHKVDQLYFLLSGEMKVEIDGEVSTVGAGSLVIFPAGTPHRNWNETDEPTVHIAIFSPLPPASGNTERVTEGTAERVTSS